MLPQRPMTPYDRQIMLGASPNFRMQEMLKPRLFETIADSMRRVDLESRMPADPMANIRAMFPR